MGLLACQFSPFQKDDPLLHTKMGKLSLKPSKKPVRRIDINGKTKLFKFLSRADLNK